MQVSDVLHLTGEILMPLASPTEQLLISVSEPSAEWVISYDGYYSSGHAFRLYIYIGERTGEAKASGMETAGKYGRIMRGASLSEVLQYLDENVGVNFTMSWRNIPEGTAWFNWTPEDHKWWYTHSEQLVEVTA